MKIAEKLRLFKEINKALPRDRKFVIDFFSKILPLVKTVSLEDAFFSSDYLLPLDFDEDFPLESVENLLGNYKYTPSILSIESEIEKLDSFFDLLKEKEIIERYSIEKIKASDAKATTEVEDLLDYEKIQLINSERLHAYHIAIRVVKERACLLREFADIYIIDQKSEELYTSKKQAMLVAEYIIKKVDDLERGEIDLNLYNFYGLSSFPLSIIDDGKYLSQEDAKRIPLMKNLRELSLKNYFSIKSVIYENKNSEIYPYKITIEVDANQKKKIRKDFGRKLDVTNKESLKSMHLITESVAVGDVIFLVLNEEYKMPIRFNTKNTNGKDTYIKKLYNIAYIVNVPGTMVAYDELLADNINNGLFKKRQIEDFMSTNKLKKPTLVGKSEDGETLVLKNEILVKTALINTVPTQYQSLYINKTK